LGKKYQNIPDKKRPNHKRKKKGTKKTKTPGSEYALIWGGGGKEVGRQAGARKPKEVGDGGVDRGKKSVKRWTWFGTRGKTHFLDRKAITLHT